jgi:branched-chain amino acid transport system substrate-binding protein
VIAPISGPAAVYGQDATTLYQYEVDQFNKTHKNVQIQLIVEDGKCNGKDATSAAQKLISVDGVQAIWGGMCSSETIAAGKLAQTNKVLLIAPVSSASEISQIGDYVFRFFNDANVAQSLGEQIKKNFSNIALVAENTDYARGLYNNFKTQYTGNIAVDITFNSDEKDFNMIANKIKNVKPDGIVVVGQDDVIESAFLKGLKSVGVLESFKDKIWSIYFCSSQSFIKLAGPLANSMQCIDTPSLDQMPAKAKAYFTTYNATHEVKAFPAWIAMQKETADMTFSAIEAGNYDGTSMKNYLEAINTSHPRDGYMGKVYFDANGDLVGIQTIIDKIVDGKTQVITE